MILDYCDGTSTYNGTSSTNTLGTIIYDWNSTTTCDYLYKKRNLEWYYTYNNYTDNNYAAQYIKYKTSINDGWMDYQPHKWCYSGTSATTTEHIALGFDCWSNKQLYIIPANPSSRIREIMRSRIAPAFHVRGNQLKHGDHRETAARGTLRRVIGDDKFRKFMRCGHVSVRAKSGLVYQIFPGHDMTKVYRDGEYIERLCVVLKGDFPPTDSLIMRYLLILNDEADFRSHAINHPVLSIGTTPTRRTIPIEEPRRLVDIFSEFKRRAVA